MLEKYSGSLIPIFVILGFVFCVLAGFCAFVITWSEFEHHHLEPRRLWRLSLQSALFAFVVFLVLSFLFGLLWLHFFI